MKALLDSNIVIYALIPEHAALRNYLKDLEIHVIQVTRVEVLGFSGLTHDQFLAYETLMADMTHHEVSRGVIDAAVRLRRQRKMSLGDALIAATALERGLTLITRNARDFQWIPELSIVNPFAEPG